MRTVTDDLGASVVVDEVRRVVSLVPSLTESIAATRPEALVAATEWCTHPIGLDVERVRGTKNPDVRRIVELRPDLVVTNQEENRRLDVERLRAAGVPVWVTRVESVPEALTSMRRLFQCALAWDMPAWLRDVDEAWRDPPKQGPARIAVPIWRDPWMVVGARTFTGDLLARCGLRNVFGNARDRYPHVTVAEIIAAGPDLILLPDEPYRFTRDDGPEAFPDSRCVLVEGRLITWYGPSLLDVPNQLAAALQRSDPEAPDAS